MELVILMLWITFRMPSGVAVPLPVFLFSIGVLEGILLFCEYRDRAPRGARQSLIIKRNAREVVMPIVITSLTTAAEYLSIAFTRVVPIHTFGVFVELRP